MFFDVHRLIKTLDYVRDRKLSDPMTPVIENPPINVDVNSVKQVENAILQN